CSSDLVDPRGRAAAVAAQIDAHGGGLAELARAGLDLGLQRGQRAAVLALRVAVEAAEADPEAAVPRAQSDGRRVERAARGGEALVAHVGRQLAPGQLVA